MSQRKMILRHGVFWGCLLACAIAAAEEGGTGHYLPGSMASFIDTVPPSEAFVLRLNVISYQADVEKDVMLPLAGTVAVNADVDTKGYGLTGVWRPSWGSLSDKWSYAMGATIPFIDLTVEADVLSVKRSDSVSGVGDIMIMPLMLNYNQNADLNYTFRVSMYAPTGDYKVGRLANTGKNFWTLEPTASINYFGQKNGREAQLFFGIDFNEENSDTNYKSGTQMHLDGVVAQHFPLAKGLAGVGVTGYWYKQVTGDSGSGATFGDFKGKVLGIGPVVSYTQKLGGGNLISELKWISESGASRRLEGDTIFLKVMMKY